MFMLILGIFDALWVNLKQDKISKLYHMLQRYVKHALSFLLVFALYDSSKHPVKYDCFCRVKRLSIKKTGYGIHVKETTPNSA